MIVPWLNASTFFLLSRDEAAERCHACLARKNIGLERVLCFTTWGDGSKPNPCFLGDIRAHPLYGLGAVSAANGVIILHSMAGEIMLCYPLTFSSFGAVVVQASVERLLVFAQVFPRLTASHLGTMQTALRVHGGVIIRQGQVASL